MGRPKRSRNCGSTHVADGTCFPAWRILQATALVLSLGLLISASPCLANPAGGKVVGGKAGITQKPGLTNIDQTTDRAIINWQSFSIDRGELTQFNQPGRDSISLNRVVGNDPSQIHGHLKANGNVWLVNQNGVLFGESARVDVHGLVATTADIADSDFMKGRNHFSIPSPNPDASVVNQGSISLGDRGLGALVAPHARNSGIIQGRLGQIVIGGTPTFTLDFYGDGLIQFDATSKVVKKPDPARALAENDGKITMDGGTVLITADAAAGVVDEVINVGGVVEARSFGVEKGNIVLHGGESGIVRVAGSLDASGPEEGQSGGSVKVLGEKVGLFAGTKIDASGDSGGGEVLIGGNYQGKGPEPNARRTYVAEAATIKADALGRGKGGRVILWSDASTAFAGGISARGGPLGGDGGSVETSSTGDLSATGWVDTAAPAGSGGGWLLDPLNVQIVAATDPDATPDVPPIFENDPPVDGTSVVLASSIEGAGGDVIIEARGNITVDALAEVITGNNIRLFAKENITFENSDLSFGSFGELLLQSVNINTNGRFVFAGSMRMESLANDKTGPGIVDADVIAGDLFVGRFGSDNLPFSSVDIVSEGAGMNVRGIEGGNVQVIQSGTLNVLGPVHASGSLFLLTQAIPPGTESSGDPGDIRSSGSGSMRAGAGASLVGDGFISTSGTSISPGGPLLLIAGTGIDVDTLNLSGIAASTQFGDIRIDNRGGGTVRVTDIAGTSGLQALNGGVELKTDGSLTLLQPVFAGGNLGGYGISESILLVCNGAFTFRNEFGPGAMETPSGRFLVYSQNPAADFRNLPASQYTKLYDFPFDPNDPFGSGRGLPAEGNFFLYNAAPTLTLTANNASREYKDPDPPLTYTVTGLIDGDTLLEALSDDPTVTTTAQFASGVGNYLVDMGPETLTSPLRYRIELVDGVFTIDPATLNVQANDASRFVGEANPVFSAAVTGFKPGDDASVLNGLQITSSADFFSPPGSYGIDPFGATAANYQIQYLSGVLTVKPGSHSTIDPDGNPLQPDVPIGVKFTPSAPLILTAPGAYIFALPDLPQLPLQEDLLFSNDGNRELWGPSPTVEPPSGQ